MVAPATAKKRRAPDVVLSDTPVPEMPVTNVAEYRSCALRRGSKAIVIDGGSSMLRVGFSGAPKLLHTYPPCVSRVRDPLRPETRHVVGWEALAPPLRSTARMAFDAGIPTNAATVERLLDGALAGLGLAEENRIEHQFVITEPPCTPNAARAAYMELVFEAYDAPAVCFGIDALFAYLYNAHKRDQHGLRYAKDRGLVVACGHSATHVLPVYEGRFAPTAAKRINVGGRHMTSHLTQRLSLQHPDHATVLSQSRVETLKQQLCEVSPDFDAQLQAIWRQPEEYEKALRIVKVPFLEPAEKPQLSEEELAKAKQAKIENGRRLSELMKEKRRVKAAAQAAAAGSGEEEKHVPVKFSEEEVAPLYELLKKRYKVQRINQMADIDEDEFYMALVLAGFTDREALIRVLDDHENSLHAIREQIGADKAGSAEDVWWKRTFEDELLSVSDADLPQVKLKHKRHIKAMRGAAEARLRAKREKEAKKAAEKAAAEALEKRKVEDPEGFLKELVEQRRVLAEKKKRRAAAKQSGSDRRSLANRNRMRLIAEHAGRMGDEEETPGATRARVMRGRMKRGRGRMVGGVARGGVTKKTKAKGSKVKKKDDDDFGMRDSDWDVYRDMQVRKDAQDSDDGSAAENERLQEVRKLILELAPDADDPTVEKREGSSLMYEPHPYPDEIPIVVDRYRVPEMLFQPALVGVEQCGLIEAISTCVRSFPEHDRQNIVNEVFVSGGVGAMRGLEHRLKRDLRSVFPMAWGDDIELGIWRAKDAELDTWRGAALFAEQGGQRFEDALVSRTDFDEMGADYIREHLFGNTFVPTPTVDLPQNDVKRRMRKR